MSDDTETRTRQAEKLRREHPDWWVWFSPNVGHKGYYATPKNDGCPKLHADTPDELDALIHRTRDE